MPCAYVYIEGDGRVYQGRCVVKGIVFTPGGAGFSTDVYDGLEVYTGKKVLHVTSAAVDTVGLEFPDGVLFSHGIYVDASAGTNKMTVFFEPLEL